MPPEVGYWPLVVGSVAQVVASVQNVRTLLVKNRLTYPLLGSALLTACLIHADIGVPTINGGLLPCLIGVVMSLLPAVLTDVGAGVTKMQMAWGAWIGCAFGSESTFDIVGLGSLLGIGLALAVNFACLKWFPERRGEIVPVQPAFAVACVVVPLGYFLMG